jgi:hypothetical protein
MTSIRPRSRIVFYTCLVAATVALSAAAQAQRVGVNSAVNQAASGTPPGAATRQLVIGQEVVHNEHIATNAGGQTQILFVDGSAMTIGPDSDLTIDDFVYDPNTSTGQLTMSAARGVLRFVGGEISKHDNAVSLHTPSATVGIRGGIFLAALGPKGQLDVTFIYGRGLTVTGVCGPAQPLSTLCNTSQTITRPGFAVSVAGPGAPPSPPAPAPAAAVNGVLAQLNGKAGATGGSANPPSDATVANSGIATTISGNVAASAQQAAQNTPKTTTTTASTTTSSTALQTGLEINTVSIQGQPQIAAVDQAPPAPGTPITPPTHTPVVISFAGAAKATNGHGTSLGFIDQSPAGVATYAGGTLIFPSGSPQNGVFTAFIPNFGQLIFPLVPGTATFGPQGTASQFGTFSGTSFLAPNDTFFYAEANLTQQPSQRGFIFGGQPVSQSFYAPIPNTQITAFAVQPEAATGSPVPFVLPQFGGALSNPTISPFYLVTPPNQPFGGFNAANNPTVNSPRWLQASLAINGQGASQSSVFVVSTGVFATDNAGNVNGEGVVRGSLQLPGASGPTRLSSGVATVADGNGNALFGSNSISGFVLDQNQFNNGNFVQATAAAVPFGSSATNYSFTTPVTASTVPTGVGSSRTTQTLTGTFGGIMYPSTSVPYIVVGDASVSTDATKNRVAATFTGTDPITPQVSGINQMVLQFGGLTATNDGSRGTFIDDNNFAATESTSTASQINGNNLPFESSGQPGTRLAMVTANTVPVGLSGVAPNGSLVPVTPCQCQYLQWGYWTGELDQTNANGQITRLDRAPINTWVAGQPTVNMPTTGSGTFLGAAIGSVFNNGASYIAAGNFSNMYDFGSNTGTVQINNFDGRNIAIPVNGRAGSPLYSGSMTGTNLQAAVAGNFYGPTANETGGSFAMQGIGGPTYIASGIFNGKR